MTRHNAPYAELGIRDVLSTASLSSLRAPRGCSLIAFEVILHIRGMDEQYHTMLLKIGPGNNPEPVIVIGFFGEF